MNIAKALIATTIFLFGVQDYFGQTTPNTWYVRSDGGTPYSAAKPQGQCNGLANAPYPGSGVNQACAFGDIRSLWADGEYTTGAGFPKWGWVGAGGDTYIIDCPTACRIGHNGPNANDYLGGLAGNPYGSGMPPPPSGSASAPTQILGANWANCTDDSVKAHLNGGYGVNPVINLSGASYVTVQCLDITDHSSCTRTAQNTCHTSYPLDDYATSGIAWSNTTNNVSLTDIRVHGMAANGMIGPPGDGVTLVRVAIVGNALSGWNMDKADGTTGTGTLILNKISVLWNGCAEEYPIVDALPYNYCTDDSNSGYGDGIGTANVVSNPPWQILLINSTAAYNTQDGFDFLHMKGPGSAISVQNSLAYSNMGQQLKLGALSTSTNNLIVGNCEAMKNDIPGTPAGYNTHLSDFCRAANTAVALGVSDAGTTYFEDNTVLTDGSTGIELDCNGTCTTASSFAYQDNIFYGFMNAHVNQYPGMIYTTIKGLFSNPGTIVTNNLTFHARRACPQKGLNEQNAVCGDPLLTDDTYHPYGFGDMSLSSASSAIGAGAAIGGVATDYAGKKRATPPSIGALDGSAQSTFAKVGVSLPSCSSTLHIPYSCLSSGATISFGSGPSDACSFVLPCTAPAEIRIQGTE